MSTPSQELVELLRTRLSAPRFDRYVRSVPHGSHHAALALYLWNRDASAALFNDLALVEVILRNALASRLRETYGDDWWQQERGPSPPLTARHRQDIREALARVARARSGGPPATGQVVAELSLGFWRFLLTNTYRGTLWPRSLVQAFPHLPERDRDTVSREVASMNRLRNRIAHLEPVYHLDLLAEHRSLVRIVGYICPDTARWVEAESSVGAVLRVRLSRVKKSAQLGVFELVC
jgi:hypothetical protein